ncbi:MAG: transporter substrate-binding domain-containing protein, partial [Butyrivibrio sp.]|nr:transporter substrate-binding domain-containing protein [Butyrivibrio sp.]
MKTRLMAITIMLATMVSLMGCGSGDVATESETASADVKVSDTAASAVQTGSSEKKTVETVKPGKLRVAMECAYAPYNWTQPDDANGGVKIAESVDYANGYDVMMAQKIADSLGLTLEIVKLDWDSLIPAVQSGTVDCVIAGQSITAEREESVDFSDPYFYASIVTLVKSSSKYASAASIADLSGAKATSQINTIWYDKCIPQIPGVSIQPAQKTAPQMLVALDSGATDIVVTDMPTAKAALIAYPDMKLLDFSGTKGDYQVSAE